MSLAHENKTEMIKELVLEIIIFLKQNSSSLEKKKILDLITLINLDQQNTNYQKSSKPPKPESIKDALSSIHCGKLLPIKKAISLTLNQLQWNIDDGEFYRKNSKIGHNYLNGNMNTELIGMWTQKWRLRPVARCCRGSCTARVAPALSGRKK